jgi:MFS family permease
MTQTTVKSGTTSLAVSAPLAESRSVRWRRSQVSRPGAIRPGAILAIVLIGQFMAVLDASVVNVAAPSIHARLHASGAGLQLVIAGYTITYAVLLVTGARLGDLLGHRRIFLSGLALFTLSSLGCGLAGSTAQLVALRLVQGVGAAMMIPQVLSLIQRTFTGSARASAMSAYSAVLALAVVVGQIAGGLLISADLFGSTWRPVFLINVPIGIVLLLAGVRLLPAGRGDEGRGLDIPGLVLLTPAVLAVVIPLVLGQPEHWPAWGWLCLAASVAGFAGFAAAERRLEARGGSPLVPARVLGLPGMRSGIVALFTVMTVFGGMFFVLALHLQGGLGDSPLRAGMTFVPSAASFAFVSLNWQRLPEWIRPWLPIGGFAGVAIGLATLAGLLRGGGSGGFWLYLTLGLIGMSMAGAFSPLMTSILIRVPVADAADATGVVVTVNQLALVTGVATFGAIYLNLAGPLPVSAGGAFRIPSAHAEFLTCLTLALVAVIGGVLTTARAWVHERPQPAQAALTPAA